jgi:hypothetical protein
MLAALYWKYLYLFAKKDFERRESVCVGHVWMQLAEESAARLQIDAGMGMLAGRDCDG